MLRTRSLESAITVGGDYVDRRADNNASRDRCRPRVDSVVLLSNRVVRLWRTSLGLRASNRASPSPHFKPSAMAEVGEMSLDLIDVSLLRPSGVMRMLRGSDPQDLQGAIFFQSSLRPLERSTDRLWLALCPGKQKSERPSLQRMTLSSSLRPGTARLAAPSTGRSSFLCLASAPINQLLR